MSNNYKNYTDDDIRVAVEKTMSMAQCLRLLGLKPLGGNYGNMKKHLQRLNITADHWTGQGWNKNQQLKEWGEYSKASTLKPHLIRERGHQCENCHLAEWLGLIILLEIHHINGDSTNNTKDNLQLLCPNCHSQTNNWRNKSEKKLYFCKDCDAEISNQGVRCITCAGRARAYGMRQEGLKVNKCGDCGSIISRNATRCQQCSCKHKETINWPPTKELVKMVGETSYVATARVLGVSDNSIRKRIKNHPVI